MSRRALLILAGLLLVATILGAREYMLSAPGFLVVHFFDVGQGDGALLVSPSGRQIVIDGGLDFAELEGLGKTMPFFDRSIDLLVLSHPQLDHLRSFPELLRRYRIGAVLLTGVVYHLPHYEEFLALLKEQKIPIIVADPRRDLDLGDGLTLDVLWPPPVLFGKTLKADINNSSIALRARYHDHCILFTGDMEKREEDAILASGAELRCDVLKVAHHGSKTSTSSKFLAAVQPQLAVISVGKGNRYGHPSPEVLARLKTFHIPVRRTDEEGEIVVRLK